MKILKKDSVWIGTCDHCNEIIKENPDKIYQHDNDIFSWIDCPKCSKIVSVCIHKK
jgi:hypothetical protein